jgi:hypothetical protein
VTVPDAESNMPTISTRVPREVKDWIRAEAAADDVPMSDIVRMIVVGAYEDRELTEHEEGNAVVDEEEWGAVIDDEAGAITYPEAGDQGGGER